MIIQSRRAQTILSTVFVIGIIVAVIAVTLAFLAGSLANTGYGARAAEQAFEVASSGVRDGMLQLVRQGLGYPNSGIPYTLAVGQNTANVTITLNSPVTNEATIISSATVGGRTRKIQAIVSINPVTDQVITVSSQELTL